MLKSYSKEYYQKNKHEKWLKPELRRMRKLRFHYKMTPEQYDVLLQSQNGKCAICKQPPVKGHLSVDHDHETKRIRGLLCLRCNSAIGFMKEDKENVRAMLSYLERYE